MKAQIWDNLTRSGWKRELISPFGKALSCALTAGLLAACGSNVTLQMPTIPEPLTEKIPASVGLRMPPEFQNYVHDEDIIGREHWTIDLGNSNAALFTQLFQHMFDKVTLLTSADDPASLPIDVLIEPSIEAFEFSVPNQSKTESFAVWIRYRIKVFDYIGTEVANWPVSAYGKIQTQSISGSKALQRAAILAMRDAAALMIMKLDEATGISQIAATHASGQMPAAAVSSDNDADTPPQEESSGNE